MQVREVSSWNQVDMIDYPIEMTQKLEIRSVNNSTQKESPFLGQVIHEVAKQ